MTVALERPTKKSRSAQIREQLGYPIIDTDVHTQEFEPAFLDYLAEVGGAKLADSFRDHLPGAGRYRWFQQTPAERHTYVTSNAYSMVERGILSEEDLQYFLSIHTLELYTSLNRDFFKGTVVEKAANEFLETNRN